MAENFIKHDDLIEGGNPFAEANAGLSVMIEQLEKLLVMLKGDLKQAVNEIGNLNIVKEQDQKQLMAYEQKINDLEAQIVKLNDALNKLSEAKKKTTEKTDEEIKASIKAREESKKRNSQLTEEVKSEKRAADSLDSMRAKLKALTEEYNKADAAGRNKLAPGIQKLTSEVSKAEQAIGKHQRSVGNYEIAVNKLNGAIKFLAGALGIGLGIEALKKFGEKVISSTQLGDEFEAKIGGIKTAMDVFFKSVATGNWDNFITKWRDAIKAGQDYVKTLDDISDRQRSLTIEEADSREKILKLTNDLRNVNLSYNERLQAGNDLIAEETKLSEKRKSIAEEAYKAEIDKATTLTGLSKFQIEQYIKEYDVKQSLIDVGLQDIANQKEQKNAGDALFQQIMDQADEADGRAQSYADRINLLDDTARQAIADAYKNLKDAGNSAEENLIRVHILVNSLLKQIKTIDRAEADRITEENRQREISDIILQIAQSESDSEIEIKKLAAEEIRNIEKDLAKDSIDISKDATDRKKELFDELAKARQENADKEKLIEQEKEEFIKQVKQRSYDILRSLGDYYAASVEANYNKEIEAAGNNEVKKAAIDKKYAQERQKVAVTQAFINAALGITEVWARWASNPVYAIILTAIEAAAVGIQVATIKKQKFAEGGYGLLDFDGGVLPGKSHAEGGVNLGEIGEAERGEYFGIINKPMTNKYRDILPDVFNSLNRGEFENIWGNALSQIKPVVIQQNNDRILKDINKNIMLLVSKDITETDSQIIFRYGNKTYINNKH